MSKKQKVFRGIALSMGTILSVGALFSFAGCDDTSPIEPKNTDALYIMTEDLNGLFNPFYSTAGTDMDVVGQTQISMLTTNKNAELAFGDEEAVVVKDYEMKTVGGNSEYYFVIKNGIKFSDGKPLTMNDVFFNLYVYLDPAYTGSTTMYSTKIVGLQKYRLQRNVSGDNSAEDTRFNKEASDRANNRTMELVNLFQSIGRTSTQGSYSADETKMRAAINDPAQWSISNGYRRAIASNGDISDADARKQLLDDYEEALVKFREELERDYDSAQSAYTEDPYKKRSEFQDPVLCFMYMEGFATAKYAQVAGQKEDKNNITEIVYGYPKTITTKDAAVTHVYNSTVSSKFDQIVQFWATGSELRSEFVGTAKSVINHETLEGSDTLRFPAIDGIKSLGHHLNQTEVVVNGNTYKVASAENHNADGTVKNADEYDVLRITVEGTDPKAQWNFAFTVAPYHYYSDPSKYSIDIQNNKFGVSWSDYKFMTDVIQGKNSWGVSKNKVPLGAGPYIATDSKDSDQPDQFGFQNNGLVYYKANENFLLHAPYIKRLRYKILTSNNALGDLKTGATHFVEPQFTKENSEELTNSLSKRGIESVSTWQLGYGYIGINAGKVQNINLRKAIMSAMNTRDALQYYSTGTVANISWPMSAVSWAYPRSKGAALDPAHPVDNMDNNTGKDYMSYTDEATAKKNIERYMQAAGVSAGDSRLKVTFTVAGANVSEHPIYLVFKNAMDLLNECGWNVEVVPDQNALIKLSTGSLSVWAAAWGSTIDPDMYQVYHKNSTATSVLSWGYREILASQTTYPAENKILTEMSGYIDDAREITDRTQRTSLYRQAMDCVLQLAVELPVYQRQTLYAYNANFIDVSSLPAESDINSYNSPLSKIWDVKLVNN